MVKKMIFCFCFLFSFAMVGYAETSIDPVATESVDSYLSEALGGETNFDANQVQSDLKLPSIGEVIFKMSFFLVLVLLMVFSFYLVVQWFIGKGKIDFSKQQSLFNVLAFQKLDVKRGIYVVEFLDKVLLLSAEADGLRILSEVTDAEEIVKIKSLVSLQKKSSSFGGLFEKVSEQYQSTQSLPVQPNKDLNGLTLKFNEIRSRLNK